MSGYRPTHTRDTSKPGSNLARRSSSQFWSCWRCPRDTRAVLLNPVRGLRAPGAVNMAPPQAAPRRHRGAPQLGWPATWGQLCCPPKYTASHLCALRKRHNRRFITPGTTNTDHFPFHICIYTHNHTHILPRMTQHSCRSHTPRSGAAEPPPAQPASARLKPPTPQPRCPPALGPARLGSLQPGSALLGPALPSIGPAAFRPHPRPKEGWRPPSPFTTAAATRPLPPPLRRLSCRRRGEAPSLAPVTLAEPGVFLRHLNVYTRPSRMGERCEGVGCYRNKKAIGSAAERLGEMAKSWSSV